MPNKHKQGLLRLRQCWWCAPEDSVLPEKQIPEEDHALDRCKHAGCLGTIFLQKWRCLKRRSVPRVHKEATDPVHRLSNTRGTKCSSGLTWPRVITRGRLKIFSRRKASPSSPRTRTPPPLLPPTAAYRGHMGHPEGQDIWRRLGSSSWRGRSAKASGHWTPKFWKRWWGRCHSACAMLHVQGLWATCTKWGHEG